MGKAIEPTLVSSKEDLGEKLGTMLKEAILAKESCVERFRVGDEVWKLHVWQDEITGNWYGRIVSKGKV